MLKIVRALFAAIVFSSALPAQAQTDLSSLIANAKQEKEVVWYTTTSAGDNQAVVAGFNKKYPFLKVQVLRSTGEKLRQRILTEAAAGQFYSDAASVSSMEMGLLKSKNLLQPYDPPEAANYPVGTKDKEKYFTAIYARNFVMGYNTAMIAEKDRPKDWPTSSTPSGRANLASTKKRSNGTAPWSFRGVVRRGKLPQGAHRPPTHPAARP
jgi:ABC-type Fe3+ transport system, periplasmic component